MTASAHVAAVKALIGSSVRLADGNADGVAAPYAVLYMDDGLAARTTLAAISDRREVSFQITSVGKDADGARSVAERVRTAVLDKRPVVADRQSSPVVQDVAQPLRLDRDVDPPLFYVVDGYSFITVPA